MKTGLFFTLLILLLAIRLMGQRNCSTFTYQQQELKNNPSLIQKINAIEAFTRLTVSSTNNTSYRTSGVSVIKIPVVVHILYHLPSENISDELVFSQIAELNRDFRRQNADAVNTPSYFKLLAADCEIEFELAKSDSRRKSTSGILRKYTPINLWESDDKMKSNTEMGDDAWDSKSYLNIWVCNLDLVSGFSSVPGGPENKDGVVIGFQNFGVTNSGTDFNMGKTTVHEVGHWLNLKHLWGDATCGDDGVDDTPRQTGYNIDCPKGIRITCNNGPHGDMYMNYMDFTSDACMNMFTNGQKARMRALFVSGGSRNSILSSTGLSAPLIFEVPLPDEPPRWLHPQLYPNPATTEMMIDLAFDVRWIGKTIAITNLQGQTVMQIAITSKNQKINISKLQSGMYLLTAKKEDGDFIKQKFIKI